MIYLLLVSIVLNIFFGYFCFKFAVILINVQESIEKSLDKIDSKYRRLSEIIKIPVFFDSPEVKSVINEITDVQDIVLEVASTLSDSISGGQKNSEEEDLE